MPDLTSRLQFDTPCTKRLAKLKTLLIFSRSIVPRSLRSRFPTLFAIAPSLSSRSFSRSLRDLFLALFAIFFSLSSRSLPGSLRDRSLALFAIAPSLSSRSLPRSLRERSLDHSLLVRALFSTALILFSCLPLLIPFQSRSKSERASDKDCQEAKNFRERCETSD